MPNDIAATTAHLIPTSEALARVSQADLVNLMVVQYKEGAGSQIDGMEAEIDVLQAEIERDAQAMFDEVYGVIMAQAQPKVRALSRASKPFGARVEFMPLVRPAVVNWERSSLRGAFTLVGFDGGAKFSGDTLGPCHPRGTPEPLRWEQALLTWVRTPDMSIPQIRVRAHLILSEEEEPTALDLPVKLARPAACLTLHRGITEMNEAYTRLNQFRAAVLDNATLTAKLHARLTQHILTAQGSGDVVSALTSALL